MPMDKNTQAHLLNLTEQGNFRVKVEKILGNMQGAGYDARIYSSLRSKGAQAEKVKNGVSKTMRSNHLAGPDGLSRAVDIADGSLAKPWDAPKVFWVHLGRLALMQGCGWGGLFGLSLNQKIKLVKFLRSPGPFRAANWMGPLGWDPAHVEVRPKWLDAIILRWIK